MAIRELIQTSVLVTALFLPTQLEPQQQTVPLQQEILPNLQRYNGDIYHIYDSTIITITNDLNRILKETPGYETLNPMVIKSMIMQESGSPNDREAFLHDPMQIANNGDFALDVLQKSDKYRRLGINDLSENFQRFAHTPRINGEWDYSGKNISKDEKNLSVMDSEDSILGGIIFLTYKKLRYDESGKPISGRTWREAVARYNGKESYADEVFSRLDQ